MKFYSATLDLQTHHSVHPQSWDWHNLLQLRSDERVSALAIQSPTSSDEGAWRVAISLVLRDETQHPILWVWGRIADRCQLRTVKDDDTCFLSQ